MSKSIFEPMVHTIEIKRSEFICHTKHVNTKQEAEDFINEIKLKHKNATHNCSCYITDGFERVDDDGEPSGTAGLPMIEVLKHHDLTNLAVVVTRYFGGIKLGGGGLIRAYAKSVSELINHAHIDVLTPGFMVDIAMTFSDTKQIDHYLKTKNIELVDRSFTNVVNYKVKIFSDQFDIIKSEINLINHSINLTKVSDIQMLDLRSIDE